MPKKNQTTMHQRGNPIANNPLMHKGGVHKKSKSSKRQRHKRETRRLVAKYMGAMRGGGGRYYSTRFNSSRSKRHKVKHFMPFFISTITAYCWSTGCNTLIVHLILMRIYYLTNKNNEIIPARIPRFTA